ncbi:MAG: HD domain-containing protein [Candidatus Rokuibacteriota bacterium]
MTAMADRLLAALASSGARRYGGERVSELEHALQCAELARAGSADEELQLACLLHDVGRYAIDQSLVADTLEAARVGPTGRGHHELGADLLAPWVSERVAWCVRMHADAKRYLCAIEPPYLDRLSPGSRHTLRLQGGVMSPQDAGRFAEHRWAGDAVALRRWDDEAKVVDKPTRSLRDWAPLILRRVGR